MTNLYTCLFQKDTLFKELNSENVYNFYNALKTIPCSTAHTHIQCSSQSAPLRESRKRSRNGPHQKRSRAIYGPFLF